MATVSCEQYPNAQKRVVGKNFLGEWVERKAGGGRLTSSQREAMGVSAGLLTGAEPRPRMENPKPPPPPAHTGPSAVFSSVPLTMLCPFPETSILSSSAG